MNATIKTDRANLLAELRTIEATEYLIWTNSGTYGGRDPRWNDRNVWHSVAGGVRETGPSEEDAPGCMRFLAGNHADMQASRRRAAEIRKSL